MSNRIEQVIGDIEEYIDGCKMQAFSNTKIVVDRPQLEEFLDELRQYTPEEVKKYQRMLSNRDKILADAKRKATEVEEKAQAYAERMVAENEITKLAYDKASEILRNANQEADDILRSAKEEAAAIREGAFSYTNDLLNMLQSILSGTIEDVNNHYGSLLSSLREHKDIVEQNQRELSMSSVPQDNTAAPKAPFFENEVSYDFDEEVEDE